MNDIKQNAFVHIRVDELTSENYLSGDPREAYQFTFGEVQISDQASTGLAQEMRNGRSHDRAGLP